MAQGFTVDSRNIRVGELDHAAAESARRVISDSAAGAEPSDVVGLELTPAADLGSVAGDCPQSALLGGVQFTPTAPHQKNQQQKAQEKNVEQQFLEGGLLVLGNGAGGLERVAGMPACRHPLPKGGTIF